MTAAESTTGDPAPGRPLVIAGMPRSGTSWTKQVLECDPHAFSIMEPDSEGHRASAIWAKRQAGRFPVLSPGDHDDHYRRLWSWILEGARESPRLQLAAKIHTVVKPAERKRYLQGGSSTKMSLAAALARNPDDRRNPALDGHRLLVKTVHAPLSIEWLASEFDIDVLVLLRHPGSILASWISVDMNDQYVPFHDNPAVRRLAAEWEVPLPGPDHLERLIWQIGILLTGLERAAAHHPNWTVRTHEQLCRQPVQEFQRLYRDLGLQWSDGAAANLAGNDRPGTGFNTQRVAAELPDDWKRRLTGHQASELQRVLAGFPLSTWTEADFRLAPDS
jgi:Sulfotransferase family